jgi:choline dehydrogenase-like flavoprotein
VLGLTQDTGLIKEPVMATLSEHEGFILSPFLDTPLVLASVVPVPLRLYFKIKQRERTLGIMVKIKDDCVGRVHKNGVVEKTATKDDLSLLEKGTNIAKDILINAGVDPQTIITTKLRGAHPGGTAAIGEVVNKNLQTKTKGLYVCDASVFPESPGAPPIVTIIALAKRLGRFLGAN